MILTLQIEHRDDIDSVHCVQSQYHPYALFAELISSQYCVYRVNIITILCHSIVMILTLQTQYSDDIDSVHSIVMILALQTQYSDDIDSTHIV